MIEFKVIGMSCGHCVATVTAAIQQHDPTATVDVDVPSGRVRVTSTFSPGILLQAIETVGYDAELVQALA